MGMLLYAGITATTIGLAYLVKNQPQLVLRAPLVYIASYLQMTPETLSRVRTAALMEK